MSFIGQHKTPHVFTGLSVRCTALLEVRDLCDAQLQWRPGIFAMYIFIGGHGVCAIHAFRGGLVIYAKDTCFLVDSVCFE